LIERIIIFIVIFFGMYLIFSGCFPRIHPGAERAVNARAGKKDSTSTILIRKIAVKLLPIISIEDMKRQRLADTLRILGEEESPELFEAMAWATGMFYALSILIVSPVFHLVTMLLMPEAGPLMVYQLCGVLAVILLFIGRGAVTSDLEKKMKLRKQAIEWELPQFSGTVLQSLGHTRNVIDILESYRKICGPALRHEIDQTLNDMRTGNHEAAIKNLAGRVGSGSFTLLAQCLIGLLRGDDQQSYFQIITKDFSKTQHELLKKELLSRPEKLTINNILLLGGMLLMLFVAIGGYLTDVGAELF